jgi:hypothetical protein
MDNAFGMQVSDGHYHLSRVKFNLGLLESLLSLINFVKLTSSDKWHHKVETHVILEQVFHADKERVFALKHDFLFQKSACDLVHFYQDIFPDALDSK